MSENTPKIVKAPRRLGSGGGKPQEIYIDDLKDPNQESGGFINKYLVVNIAAQRARELNERDLPIGKLSRSAKKPTTQALLELMDGQLKYERVEAQSVIAEDDLIFDDAPDEEVAALFEEYENLNVDEEEEEDDSPFPMGDDGEYED